METDAKVRTLGAEMRFSYESPTRISWAQEEGDLKSVEGSWELEDLGGGRTARHLLGWRSTSGGCWGWSSAGRSSASSAAS